MKKMLSFYYKNNKGFTLLETILMISIISFLTISIIKMFLFISLHSNKYKLINKNLNKTRRVLEYISHEIKRADSIEFLDEQIGYEAFNNKYPDNIGILIIVKENKNNLFITYCLDGNKLRRMSYRSSLEKIKTLKALGGYNILAKDIYGLKNTNYSKEDRYIDLQVTIDENGISKEYNQVINLMGYR